MKKRITYVGEDKQIHTIDMSLVLAPHFIARAGDSIIKVEDIYA